MQNKTENRAILDKSQTVTAACRLAREPRRLEMGSLLQELEHPEAVCETSKSSASNIHLQFLSQTLAPIREALTYASFSPQNHFNKVSMHK